MKNYFPTPRQVMFIDPTDSSDNKYAYGIAFGDKIICGCCGGVFEVEEIIEAGKTRPIGPAIRVWHEWENISDAIHSGDEYGNYTSSWAKEEN